MWPSIHGGSLNAFDLAHIFLDDISALEYTGSLGSHRGEPHESNSACLNFGSKRILADIIHVPMFAGSAVHMRSGRSPAVSRYPAAPCLVPDMAGLAFRMALPPPNGQTSRVWDSLLVMNSGCAGGCGFAPRPGQYNKERFSSYQETGKVFSPEMPFYSKF